MELVLGMSLAPAAIRMVLVEGENADGVTVEEDNFDVNAADDSPTLSAADQMVAAIIGTREAAAEAGSRLLSTGVTWTDPIEAAALRDALAARKIENVMLVSAFLAAAALAQAVGNAIGYEQTAMLFIEPTTATLAVIDSADGSITDVHRQTLPGGGHGGDAVTRLIGMTAGLHTLPSRPDGVFVVGSGVDIAPIKPRLEAATGLAVSAPEEPEMALARGAALASANAPLFASSTAALAYAQDPGTGAVDPYAVAPGYLAVPNVAPGIELGEDDLAYSAVPDEDASAVTVVLGHVHDVFDEEPQHRPMLLTGSALAVTIVTAAALALVITLAVNIRTTVALLPIPGQTLIVPTAQPPAPAAVQAPAAVAAPLHMPATQPLPAHLAVAPPPLNVHAPAAPALPAAPVPVPVPVAPVPIPARIPAPAPPVHLPAPQLPRWLPELQPPIQRQTPQPVQSPFQQPQHKPSSPSRVPGPSQRGPFTEPRGRVPGAEPPMHLAPEPPMHLPEPEAPAMPAMPAPEAPFIHAPTAPRAPAMPQMPRMPHLNIPHFRL